MAFDLPSASRHAVQYGWTKPIVRSRFWPVLYFDSKWSRIWIVERDPDEVEKGDDGSLAQDFETVIQLLHVVAVTCYFVVFLILHVRQLCLVILRSSGVRRGTM